jgi:outer membrane biosynthesis protein TonB
VILETGSLGQAMAAFEQCSRDSLKDWGVDPDIQDKIVRPVWTSNPSEWLFASDYPGEMLRSGKESEVVARLLIDANGKITKCTSLSHFDEPEFNRITCANITKRARFAPAELADGTKVPSYMVRRVVFRIAH